MNNFDDLQHSNGNAQEGQTEYSKRTSIFSYIFTIIFAVALILLVCGLNGLFTEQKSQQDIVKYVSDGFFVAAALVLGMAGLSWASKKGAFDGLGYSFSSLFHLHKPTKKRLTWSKHETYEEYVERKHAKDESKQIKHFLFIGAVMMVVAIILVIVYNFAFPEQAV